MNADCVAELTQQRAASPGVVKADEKLAYILLDPDQWKEGRLTNAAFSKTRLKAGDLSVARASYCSVEQVEEHVVKPQLDRDPGRKLVGAFLARCADIRDIKAQQPPARAICVVDDGSDELPGHALLGYSEATKAQGFWERNRREAIRANLTLAFGAEGGPLLLTQCFRRAS